jgi:hypothetical protein
MDHTGFNRPSTVAATVSTAIKLSINNNSEKSSCLG